MTSQSAAPNSFGHYPLHRDGQISPSPSFPEIEREILAYWKADGTFQASIDNREAGENGSNEFVFYDGPPFANGLPHYGHLITGYVKDSVARFRTQRGQRVERRFGWDTHGLPAELEAQRILGVDSKDEIVKMGIGTFNEACRNSVLRYTNEWEEYVNRQARWADFANDYKTLDVTYMESVLWAFKTLYDKGLAYQGFRVLPYCWNDETPLSNHELRMDEDVYRDRQDQTVTVGLRLETGELALIWTTTPWTLPTNLAIAVGADIEYLTVVPTEGEFAGEKIIIAASRLGAYAKQLGEDPQVLERRTGADLAGLRYAPIYDYFEGRADDEAPGPNAWQILTADFVSTEDGTGLVHMAPFGEDDMNLMNEHDIKVVVPVDEGGVFTSEVSDYAGMQVFDSNREILADLRNSSGPLARRPENKRARLVAQASYVHSYPHCYRCKEPLIYKPVSSWFVAVSQFRDRMVELNQQITWIPEHLKDGQFGKWLAGARDWSISRNRFWGTPIPVWVSDNPEYPRIDVYGSLAEMEADFGRLPRNDSGEVDLHRPYIDELTRPNPDDPSGQSTMRRIPDVLDCWFDSGSMPYAQVHYPFENREWFEHHYPGDFIVEYIGQTRGWFYTLHVLATALFDRPAFTNCVSHGIVLGDDGRKMSKSLRNYPDVNEVFDRDGSDAMRWFLISSPLMRGGNLVVTEKGIRDVTRQVLIPLWNVWYFYALYSGTVDGGKGYLSPGVDMSEKGQRDFTDRYSVMDRYALARTKVLADEVGTQLENFDVAGACATVRDYLDMLTNWYLRTSRDRFWEEDRAAFDTLHTCLQTLVTVMASLAPLTTEEIYRGLTGKRSVHLTDWPVLPQWMADDELTEVMEQVRDVVSTTHALRKAHHLRVRQPLASMTVVTDDPQRLGAFTDLILGEVNIKALNLISPADSPVKVSHSIKPLPQTFAPELRKATSQVFAACRAGKVELRGDGSANLPEVEVGGQPVSLAPEQFEVSTSIDLGADADSQVVADVLSDGGFVLLDTELTRELEAEGYARDLVRAIQDARKAAGLHVADRINLTLAVPAEQVPAVEANRELIMHETLALALKVSADESGEAQSTPHIGIEKVER